jgi:type IV secretory pathway TraG/TraD family ATPase VirD4
LKTSEPYASEWISKAIGEVEIERFRESRTVGRFPRNSESEQREITREPLVMASEVGGLDPLHGYLKHGNLVLRMRFPYMELASHAEKFIERTMKPAAAATTAAVTPATAQGGPDNGQPEAQRKPPQSVRKPVQKKQEQERQQPATVNEQTPFFE